MKDYLKEGGEKYRHFFNEAAKDLGFPGNYKFHVVTTEEAFFEMCQKALSAPTLLLAADTETTGFNHETQDVVGVSLCFDDVNAYYLPLAHRVGTNLPASVIPFVLKLLYKAAMVLYFNARFDLRFFRKLGADISKIKFFDVSVPLWLTDSNIRMPGLKFGAKHFLGWDMTTYEEAVGSGADLSFSSPDEAGPYACADALATWHLAKKLSFIKKRHPMIVDLDNNILRPVLLMEETPSPIDIESVTESRKKSMERLEVLEKEIHSLMGQVFLIHGGQQLGKALSENGISTGKYTDKTKQMKTGEDELKAIKDQHPVIPKILEYKKVHHFLTTYCNALLAEYNEAIGGCRFAYYTTVTPTGRLAAGADKKNSFFASMNIHAVDKPEVVLYKAEPCDNPEEPNCFKGWKFVPKSECPEWKGPWVEGYSSEQNIRKAFTAYEGDLWAHFDYKTQELRIPTNLSKEPVWLNAFLKKEDLHKAVAAMVWGPDQAMLKRKFAKALNFGALYGGTKYTFAHQLGCSEDEAQEILDKWWAALKSLTRWVRSSEALAKQEGSINTYFGRPRRVRHYFSSKNRSVRNFAKRTAVNTQVQGAGADVIKIGMCKVYDEILKVPQNLKDPKVRLLSCVHDEMNFSIRNQEPFFTAACLKIQELMQFEIPGWEVPMLVDCTIGDSWGNAFPMHFDVEQDRWMPTYS